jgi:hypothetical protein
MDTELLAPPADLDFDKAISDHMAQQGQSQPPTQPKAEKPAPKPTTQQKPQESPKKATDKPLVEDKTKEAPKNPFDKLDALKPKEEQAQEQSQQAEIPDTAPKDQQAWTHLKKSIKEANAKLAELTPIKEQFEKLQREHEVLKNKPFQLPEDIKGELEDLRTLKAAYDVEDTPEWQQRITVPFQQREGYLKKVAAHYKIDESALLAASDEPDPIVRAEKMEEVLRTGEKELPMAQAAMVNQAVNELHMIYSEMNNMRQNAQNVWSAKQGKNAELLKTQETEKTQKWQAAAQDTYQKLHDKLPQFFEDGDFAESVKGASIAEDEPTRAYQAQAGELLPHVVQRLFEAEAKIRQFEAGNQARAAAKPSMTPTDVVLPKEQGDAPTSLEEAMRMQKSWDSRRQ